ncbi:MAG: tetratricopeptide repeat protein [Phycisphaerales bacterium JB039]
MFIRTLAALACSALLVTPCGADDLRNVKRGEPLPAYKLPTIDGAVIDNEAMKGAVVVIACLSAEQRRSELVAMESDALVQSMDNPQVKLVHVTADVIRKSYFEAFRRDRSIAAPLAFDPDRSFYGKLGLIVYPTTIVVDPEGKLAHVISLHSDRYKHTLEAYILHALGQIDDAALAQRLEEHPSEAGSPKSLASAHRALARSMRERGRLDNAREELLKAREQDPSSIDILLDLADLELLMGDLDSAEALIDEALAMQATNRRARELKGIALYRRDKLDDARKTLTEALQLNPNPDRIHYYLGLICERQGDDAGALEHYREALRHLLHEPPAQPAETPGG